MADTNSQGQHLSAALVCASNQNRSMAAHYGCLRHGFKNVAFRSFGTGTHVKLPGKSLYEPNIYNFGTPYEEILKDLQEKDEKFYIGNGLIPMLQRNKKVKKAPEKFQNCYEPFDLIFSFEDRVFNAIIEELQSRISNANRPCHAVNLTVKDNSEEAEKGAKLCVEFIKKIENCEDWENEITNIIADFEKRYGVKILHVVLFV